jgi:hypothetical protein
MLSSDRLWSLRENSARTADLSTPLRSGRDDKFVKRFEIKVATNFSSRANNLRGQVNEAMNGSCR